MLDNNNTGPTLDAVVTHYTAEHQAMEQVFDPNGALRADVRGLK